MELGTIILLIVLGYIVISIIFYYFSSLFRYNMILNRYSYIGRIITTVMYKDLNHYNIDFSWWNNHKYQVISIKSFDNLNLVGYYFDKKSNNTALLVHGYASNAYEMQCYAKMFYDMDYNVLVIDNRGHGKSDGKIISMGYYEKYDISSWVNFLIDKNKNVKIVVFGISMGGASVCLYSGTEKPKNVKAIISDCAYSSAYKIVKSVANKSVVFSILPTLQVFNLYTKLKVGFKLSDINVVKQIEKCDVPMLLIHGEKDNFVPFSMQGELYNACPEQYRNKFSVENAGHGESLYTLKGKYIKKVEEFLKKYV